VADEHRLLPRYRADRLELEREQAHVLAREIERAVDEGIVRPGSLPLDRAALRGVPCVGRFSGGGAIESTRPDIEILKLDRKRRQRSRRRL
jgi:hypothetical protein